MFVLHWDENKGWIVFHVPTLYIDRQAITKSAKQRNTNIWLILSCNELEINNLAIHPTKCTSIKI